jgi:HAMP domain-containing protein
MTMRFPLYGAIPASSLLSASGWLVFSPLRELRDLSDAVIKGMAING